MTHVMKLNQEIGMASEHWERSFHQLKQENALAMAETSEEFKTKIGEKMSKIG